MVCLIPDLPPEPCFAGESIMVFTSFFNQPGRRQALSEGPAAATLTALAHRCSALACGPAHRALPVLRNTPLA